MFSLPQADFERHISHSIAQLPEPFKSKLSNVAFVVEDEPNLEQRQALQLQHHQSLFGLYQGIPLTRRGASYTMVLPDKITIFKLVIEASCHSEEEVIARIHETVWHEIAHHFGLDHDRIDAIMRKTI